jgi:hypothetical protein
MLPPFAEERELAIKLGILESINDHCNSFILVLFLNIVLWTPNVSFNIDVQHCTSSNQRDLTLWIITEHCVSSWLYRNAVAFPKLDQIPSSDLSNQSSPLQRDHLKNGVFWDLTPCGSCKNRRFGGT